MISTQNRSIASMTLQQHANKPAVTLLADQAVAIDNDYLLNPEKDLYRAITSGGDVTVTLKPGDAVYAFKPYKFQKIHASNSLIVAADAGDANGIEGAASISITDENEMLVIYWDPDYEVWRRSMPGGSAAGVGGALLAANNLDDLDDAPTALDNLGGTTVGKALFTAADAAAARTAVGAGATGSSLITAATAQAALTALGFANYADDAAAAAGGVAVGGGYQTAGVPKTRMV